MRAVAPRRPRRPRRAGPRAIGRILVAGFLLFSCGKPGSEPGPKAQPVPDTGGGSAVAFSPLWGAVRAPDAVASTALVLRSSGAVTAALSAVHGWETVVQNVDFNRVALVLAHGPVVPSTAYTLVVEAVTRSGDALGVTAHVEEKSGLGGQSEVVPLALVSVPQAAVENVTAARITVRRP